MFRHLLVMLTALAPLLPGCSRDAGLQPASTIYLNGLTEAATGQDLFYFEIPLE